MSMANILNRIHTQSAETLKVLWFQTNFGNIYPRSEVDSLPTTALKILPDEIYFQPWNNYQYYLTRKGGGFDLRLPPTRCPPRFPPICQLTGRIHFSLFYRAPSIKHIKTLTSRYNKSNRFECSLTSMNRWVCGL